jgi:hypothetical protein
MTSHIFLALGMWPETVAANRRAIALANSMMASHRMTMDCGHGAGWLVYARLQEGQDPVDDIERCGKAALDPAAIAKDQVVIGGPEADVGSYADMLVRRGVETGKWAEVVKLPAGHFEYARFTLAYGRMLAARHDATAAKAALAEMRTSRQAIAGALPRELPDEGQLLPWLDRGIAQGEAIVALASGDRAGGLAKLRAAAEAEQALPVVFGPPQVQILGWELLGRELLADGKKVEAADAFRHALEMAPGRRIATMGLKAATGA